MFCTVLFLLFLPLISGAAIDQFFIGDRNGIEIRVPNVNILEVNSYQDFHFHIFNKSNGVPLLNDTIECHFHLYNSSGNHVHKEENMQVITDTFDFEVELNAKNFSKEGTYPYLIQCNGTSSEYIGGFVAGVLKVTSDGLDDNPLDTSAGIAVTIFILICALGFLLLPFLKKDFIRNDFSNLILKRCCFVVGIYLMMLNSAILSSISSINNLGVEKEMFRYMWLFGWVGYGLMVFIVFKTILDVLAMWKVKKDNKRMGDDLLG